MNSGKRFSFGHITSFFLGLYAKIRNRNSKKEANVTTEILTQRDSIKPKLAAMLISMNYSGADEIIEGLLDIINMISDYHEEGVPLFPEIIVADSEHYFKTFNNYRIKIARKDLNRHEFSQSVKMCAPLATEGWNIYIIIDVKNDNIEYGMVSTGFKVMSLNLYEQTMTAGIPEINALYLRGIGNNVVEVRNVGHRFLVVLNLSDEYIFVGDTIKSLVDIIVPQDDTLRELKNYLEKTMLQTINEGHGNLIAVVCDDANQINSLSEIFRGGIWLDTPIDLKKLTTDYQTHQTDAEPYSLKLQSYANIMRSMLNFDGITLFTDQGKILGYHFIVNNNEVREENVMGGSRTRAFLALCDIPEIKACFMKSQDGKIKFKNKKDE